MNEPFIVIFRIDGTRYRRRYYRWSAYSGWNYENGGTFAPRDLKEYLNTSFRVIGVQEYLSIVHPEEE